MQYLSEKDMARLYPARHRFARLLRRAFPGPSDMAVAEKAGPVLGATPRTVQNWLQCRNDAKVSHVLAVLAIVGADAVFDVIGGKP